ncbi:type II toxin-antitoxin system RelE family toxin [Segetibacter aerophilus]|uniref:ParE-like toxin domain-containing protein n=1 Tax=Segetibacter aerophilus TaxID=670293 RepID=A0A512B6H6_9BACT|nr:hypothetical protein [Segetibacter aerophilus]GEO07555.1 hypothetical protein SAE01_00510 [Segetibacter aerophilus]
MNSVTTERFRKAFSNLPKDIQERARKAYTLWKQDNFHPSLHFKQVHKEQAIYSVRVGLSYRALGVKQGETIIWFWIGSHEDYNNLLTQLKD